MSSLRCVVVATWLMQSINVSFKEILYFYDLQRSAGGFIIGTVLWRNRRVSSASCFNALQY